MATTKIEWADMVWNPVTGCDPVSEGCRNCYAKRFAKRLKAMGVKKYENEFQVTVHPETFEEPLKIKKPKKIFVCSMGDLFHPAVPPDVYYEIMRIITRTPHHTYFVLTKRPKIIPLMFTEAKPDNLWIGVTAENQKRADERIPVLIQKVKKNKFVSCEPILGFIDLKQSARMAGLLPGSEGLGVDWVIVGGETGPGARITDYRWITELYRQCSLYKIPFFFKQWGKISQSKWEQGAREIILTRYYFMPRQWPKRTRL